MRDFRSSCRGPWLALLIVLATVERGLAAEAPVPAADAAIFEQSVLPLLQKHCSDCHSEDETQAKLRLDSRTGLLNGAASGPVVTPGNASTSLLMQLIAKDSKPHMPPDGQLSEAEIETLAKWIDLLPKDALPKRDAPSGADHWAFQPLAQVEPPQVKDTAWPQTPIDRFVLAKLEEAGLAPSPPVHRALLVRRVYFDLVGLPPTPEAVQEFLDDTSPDAYERLVDRLLASPAYGERWGRHWLDLARYADSGGFHDDVDRPYAWRYRDYVIRSFNADKPYSEFVREQLAGDEAAPHDVDAWTATGFCRNGPSNEDNMGPNTEKYRLDQLDDVISTASSVFLAQTLGCARCHDHKYDPILQSDYYRFLAIFNSGIKVDVPLDENGQPQEAKPTKEKSKLPRALMGFTDAKPEPRKTYLLWRGDANNRGPEVEPGVPAALSAQPVSFTQPADEAKTTGRRLVLADWVTSPSNPLAWRVVVNRIWQHHFGYGLVATPSNFGRTGTAPSHPELLDWLAQQMIDGGGHWKPLHRIIVTSAVYQQSARWRPDAATIDGSNRLLWRMNLRRLEGETIRDAILAVAGTMNRRPGGPGIKPRLPADMLDASQRNKWPVVQKEGPEHWRRSVYIYFKRQLPFPMLELFDAPSSNLTCDRRDQSVVPTQALVLMNDEFTQEQASYFADRAMNESKDDIALRASRALSLALCRQPQPERIDEAVQFLGERSQAHQRSGLERDKAEREALVDLCHVLLNCNEFLYVD